MAPLVADGETLQNGEIEEYLQRNLGKRAGSPNMGMGTLPTYTGVNMALY
jgi:hypothetical protein